MCHPQHPSVDILGIPIHRVDFTATLAQIASWITNTQAFSSVCHQICTVNPEFLVDAHRNPEFAAVLHRADLRVADGVGILWAARLLGSRLPERVTGSDGIYRICEQAASAGWRIYFLGAGPGIAERAASALQRQYRHLQVAGTYSGSPNDRDWPEISHRLRQARPDLIFVAFGHPRQDYWISRHRHELPAAVSIGVGGAFDFVAGIAVRAPEWVQRMGLEWLHRLLHQPWRWRRMAKLPIFVLLVLKQRISRGMIRQDR